MTQWFTRLRVYEVLSLTVGSVYRAAELVDKIGIAPSNVKGGSGRSRWVPVLPESRRARERHLSWLCRRIDLTPDLPLLLSRESDGERQCRALHRESARRIIQSAFAAAGIVNDGRLGTHTLRKTWARRVYENCGHDWMILKSALNHSSVSVTQAYLEPDEDQVLAAMMKCDLTRRTRVPTPAAISA